MRRLTFLFLFLSSFIFLQAQDVSGVQAQLDVMEESADLKHAAWGFCLYDVESGKKLLSRNDKMSLLPASTMKTVTSSAALGILGEDFRFETHLEYDGEIVDGVLKGNLYIKGGGDPTLGSDRFAWGTKMESILDDWQEALSEAGHVRGKLALQIL